MNITANRALVYPMALEREYARAIKSHTEKAMDIVDGFIPRMIALWESARIDADDTEDELAALMLLLASALQKLPDMENECKKMFERVLRHEQKEIGAVVKSVFGAVAEPGMAEAVKKEERLAQLKRIWVSENLDLIKSIDAEVLRKVRERLADSIIDAVDKKRAQSELVADIERIAQVEENRAVLIGSDQVGKLSGRIAEYEQRALGVDRYIWRTMMDDRVRPAHAEREGDVFDWDNPPKGGHPGQAIRCRCRALPVFDTEEMRMKPIKGRYKQI